MTLILETKNLRKTYKQGEVEVEALKDVSVRIQKGEFVSIMGPSGSGKSTLLHLVGGLEYSTSGEVIVEGKPLSMLKDNDLSIFRRRRLGFIFQFFNLLPTLTAIENVTLPLLLDGKSFNSVSKKAKDLLFMMGLEKRIHHRPDQLSGGEMQRVAIARALVTDPLLILADEPTGNLDTKSGEIVLTRLEQLAKEEGQTIVMVTHDTKAASFGTRKITIQDGNIKTDEAVLPRKITEPQVDLNNNFEKSTH